jgi:thiol-disulfide isomerase/thioredoxin
MEIYDRNISLVITKMNADLYKEVAERYGVVSYPTFHYFRNGSHQASFVPRFKSAAGLLDQILGYVLDTYQRQPDLTVFESGEVDLIEEFIKSTRQNEFALVMRGYKLSAKVFAYKAAVKEFIARYAISKIRCAFVNTSKSEGASLKMFRPGFHSPDAKEISYGGKWEKVAIGRWAKVRTYPSVGSMFHLDKYGWSAMNEINFDAAVVGILSEESEIGACSASVASERPTSSV